MLLVNDPNTALAGSLRPSREHPLWAALRRPFERPPLPSELEDIPGLRPRTGRWLGAALLLALTAVLAGVGLDRAGLTSFGAVAASVAPQQERVGATTLALRPAPASAGTESVPSAEPPRAAAALEARAEPLAFAASVAPSEPPAQAVAAPAPPPRAAATAPAAKKRSAPAAKKKAAARPLRRAVGRALSGRPSSR